MKKLLLFILPVFLVFSCSKTKEVIEETYPDGSAKIVRYYKGEAKDKVLLKEVCYYPNKKIQYEGEFDNNQRNGKWIYWYDNGNKWSEGFLKKEINDGKRTVWYENGQKRYEGTYKDGKEVGKWEFFDETGKLIKEIDFDTIK
jgi:antitoxin component YwqK of YwqJK toxin-antitoxin module